MTKHHNDPENTNLHPVTAVVRDCARGSTRPGPHHMPAGGWFREVATSENWRTTTIVQRHRDRAVMTPLS